MSEVRSGMKWNDLIRERGTSKIRERNEMTIGLLVEEQERRERERRMS